ncbi:hypothetical protein [Chryseobacterium sp. 18068]|uniref:hypothetical protein n=1 Tax=Chryseobacterium sp. 18068 TaxID=2681414 RepID=UPI001358055C|nr:hypothetical protein [Chryseobacterium sp. 18068]
MGIRRIAFAVIIIIFLIRLIVVWTNLGDNVNLKIKKSIQWILGLLMVSLAINSLAHYGFGIGKSIFDMGGSGGGSNQVENIDQVFSTSPINENNQSNDTVKYYNPLNGQ